MSRKAQSRRERGTSGRTLDRWLADRFTQARDRFRSRSAPATTVRIPVSEFAAQHGFRESAVISRIRKGIYDGTEADGEWFVIRRSDWDSEPGRGPGHGSGSHAGTPESPKRIPRRPLRWPRYVTIALALIFPASLVLNDTSTPWLTLWGEIALGLIPIIWAAGALAAGTVYWHGTHRREASPGTFWTAVLLLLVGGLCVVGFALLGTPRS